MGVAVLALFLAWRVLAVNMAAHFVREPADDAAALQWAPRQPQALLSLGAAGAAQDAGRAAGLVMQSLRGNPVSGLGYALMEELTVEDGRVTSLSFGDYKMPTIADLPPLKTVLLESTVGVGPYAVRGIGEAPTAPIAPAIANAIEDAIGVRIRTLPITPEKVYRAIREKNGE